MEARSFRRAFEIKRCIERYMNMLCKRVSLSIGESGGDALSGTFREKRIVYLGSFLGPSEY
jgi:hypothetical protein